MEIEFNHLLRDVQKTQATDSYSEFLPTKVSAQKHN